MDRVENNINTWKRSVLKSNSLQVNFFSPDRLYKWVIVLSNVLLKYQK